MNLFQFLTNKRGAIKTLPALGISVAAGVAFIYTANFAAHKQIEAERQVRTLSSISQTSPQAGMHRQGGLLTSINVRDGRNELATSEERAAMGGNSALDRYNANQRALEQMGNYVGRAAAFSESEGLGGGGKEADFVGGGYVQGAPTTVGGDAMGALSGAQAGQPAGQPGTDAPVQQLASASITRASGSTFGGSAGGVSGGGTGGSVNGGRNGAPAVSPEGIRMSGAMPGGTNIVSRMGLDHSQSSTDFGRGRDSRVTRGQRITQSQDEVKDILNRTAKTAAKVNPGANEGAAAFLAGNTRSGGLEVDGGNNNQGGSSPDLTAPTKHRLKAIGNRLKDVGNHSEKRNSEHDVLVAQLIATVVGSLGMMFAGAKILSFWDKKIRNFLLEHPVPTPAIIAQWNTYRIIRWAIAGAMIAAVTGFNAWLYIRAAKFIEHYGSMGGTLAATLSKALAPALVAGMVATALKPDCWSNLGKTIWSKIKGTFDPISMATNSVTNSLFK